MSDDLIPYEPIRVEPDVPQETLDTFDTSQSAPLTERAGWSSEPLEFTFVLGDPPNPDGTPAIVFRKEWMVDGHMYGVTIKDGVEEWWKKIDGAWVRQP